MTTGDEYLYQRAEAEIRMAEQAVGRAAVQAHYDLATRYLDLFYKVEGPVPEAPAAG